jgi:hypothetical protein
MISNNQNAITASLSWEDPQAPENRPIEVSNSPTAVFNSNSDQGDEIVRIEEVNSTANQGTNSQTTRSGFCSDIPDQVKNILSQFIPTITTTSISTAIYLSEINQQDRNWSVGLFSGLAFYTGKLIGKCVRDQKVPINYLTKHFIPSLAVGLSCFGNSFIDDTKNNDILIKAINTCVIGAVATALSNKKIREAIIEGCTPNQDNNHQQHRLNRSPVVVPMM